MNGPLEVKEDHETAAAALETLYDLGSCCGDRANDVHSLQ